jgi:hypothetical protein
MIVFLYVVLALAAIIAFLGFISPKNYHVKRSIIINKPLPDVFNYVKYIKNQDHWSPWKKKDPEMKQEAFGIDGEVGFINKWEGNKDVGVGEQEIIRVVDNDVIESQLRFFKPWKSQSDAYIKVKKVDDQNTEVEWGFRGENKFPSSIFMMLYNIDKHVGKDFDEGLLSLKELFDKK